MTDATTELSPPTQQIGIIALRGDPVPVLGKPGFLRTIPIESLRVDRSYQRRINVNSARVVHRICMGFDWSRFLPVIVVKEGKTFQIIDGQHRTTAARTIGIEEVPCHVLDCSVEEAAAAFAAINGTVTPVSPQDVWFAELHAKNVRVMAINRLLKSCGVRIVREREGGGSGTPVPSRRSAAPMTVTGRRCSGSS